MSLIQSFQPQSDPPRLRPFRQARIGMLILIQSVSNGRLADCHSTLQPASIETIE